MNSYRKSRFINTKNWTVVSMLHQVSFIVIEFCSHFIEVDILVFQKIQKENLIFPPFRLLFSSQWRLFSISRHFKVTSAIVPYETRNFQINSWVVKHYNIRLCLYVGEHNDKNVFNSFLIYQKFFCSSKIWTIYKINLKTQFRQQSICEISDILF